jgi:hypothetical protein
MWCYVVFCAPAAAPLLGLHIKEDIRCYVVCEPATAPAKKCVQGSIDSTEHVMCYAVPAAAPAKNRVRGSLP